MDADEKEIIMRRFQRRELDVLIATTVIEVGVDVPNATMMVIEHAERFGLAQMHQLRGRVGRGSAKSYCILMTGGKISPQAVERLAAMVRTQNGFELAELDLQLRGPGEFFGTRQAGIPDFRVANLVRDRALLELAKAESASFVSTCLRGDRRGKEQSVESAARGLATPLWPGRRRVTPSSLTKDGCPYLARFSRDVGYALLFPSGLPISAMHLAVTLDIRVSRKAREIWGTRGPWPKKGQTLPLGGEALVAGKMGFQFLVLDHPDLQLHLDDFERADVACGGVQGRSVHRRHIPRRQIEEVRGAAAKLRQQHMRCRSQLKPDRDQRTVDLNTDVAGKLKDEASRSRLDVGAATNPGSTIGNDPAEPGYNQGLVFRQKRGQIKNII